MKRRVFLLIFIFSVLLALGGCDHIFHYSYSIEGVISVEDTEKTLADVSIHLEGENVDEIITTDKGGKFQATRLSGEITLTPVKNGWEFSPGSRTVSSSDKELNFMASPAYYQAGGRITYENDQGDPKPVSEVEVFFSGGFESVTTDDSGYWTSGDLRGTVKVSPGKEGYTFYPSEVEVSEAKEDVNFTATVIEAADYSVGGQVTTEDGQGLAGVEITFNRGFSSVETGSQGYWHKEGLKGEVKISPALEGYIFDPNEEVVEEEDLDINFEATPVDIEESYSISGAVLRDLDDENSGIPDVEIKLEGEEIDTSVYTGSDGRWSKSDLVGPVEVTPQLEDWVFKPSLITVHYDFNNKDDILFEGTPKDIHEIYEVSGFVNNLAGEGIPSILIEFRRDGEVIGTAVTTSDGDWTKERLWGEVKVVPWGTPPDFDEDFAPEEYKVNGPDGNVNFIIY